MDEQLVIRTMRTILREQCTFSYMRPEVKRFIFDDGLLKVTRWPAFCVTLTDAGAEYIRENEEVGK